MTAIEAKKKVCPFMSNCVATSDNAGEYIVYCIAGECMAWEHTKETEQIKISKHKELKEDEKEGYCVRLKDKQ